MWLKSLLQVEQGVSDILLNYHGTFVGVEVKTPT